MLQDKPVSGSQLVNTAFFNPQITSEHIDKLVVAKIAEIFHYKIHRQVQVNRRPGRERILRIHRNVDEENIGRWKAGCCVVEDALLEIIEYGAWHLNNDV